MIYTRRVACYLVMNKKLLAVKAIALISLWTVMKKINNNYQNTDDIAIAVHMADLSEGRKCSMDERRRHLNQVCATLDEWHKENAVSFTQGYNKTKFILDDTKKIIICGASHAFDEEHSNILISDKSFNRYLGVLRKHKPSKGHNFKKKAGSDLKSKLYSAQYIKIIFVRHPIQRLLSVVQDRDVRTHYSQKYQSLHHRIHHQRKSIQNTSEPQISDILTLIAHKYPTQGQQLVGARQLAYDKYWRSVIDTCYPCHIKYDLIFKYETFSEDLNELNVDANIGGQLNAKATSDPSKLNRTIVRSRYHIPRLWFDIPVTTRGKLMKLFRYDFEMFDYGISPDGRANCESQSADNSCC